MSVASTAHIPVSDPSALTQMISILDQDSLKEIVDGCLADATEKTALILEVGSSDDWDEAAKLAHDIKSTAGQIGAARLRDVAVRLEAICKSDDTTGAIDLIDQLKSAAAETLDAYCPEALPAIFEEARNIK